MVTRGVPVPEPRVAAVVECVVEERVVGKPWEGPTFAPRGAAVRVPVRAGPWVVPAAPRASSRAWGPPPRQPSTRSAPR